MSSPEMLAHLEGLLAQGRDNALLRFGLGSAKLAAGDADAAAEHFRRAVAFDAGYSAAWKGLGKALAQVGRVDEARAAYESGIAAARAKGDKQAEKEMAVFLKRLSG